MAGMQGFTLWLTGLSGAGKTTMAVLLEQRLRAMGAKVEVLDGDAVRTRFSKRLGYSKEDRDEQVSRVGYICELLSRNGIVAIAALVSPYREIREQLRTRIPNFIEVYVECPLDALVARDVKGLYKKALSGEIEHFTGVSDPYEPPLNPEVTIDSSRQTPEESIAAIWAALERLNVIPNDRPAYAHKSL